jgi:hypothetical protein
VAAAAAVVRGRVPAKVVTRAGQMGRRVAQSLDDSQVGVATLWIMNKRAEQRGIAEVLRLRGGEIASRGQLREAIAFFRLLDKISDGDLTRIPYLLRKFGPEGATEAEMWAVLELAGFDVSGLALDGDRIELIDRLAEPIERELAATGVSSISDWLITHQRYNLADPQLRNVTDRRIELALEARVGIERAAATARSVSDRQAVIGAIGAISEAVGAPVFAAGSTLLEEVAGVRLGDLNEMEFGTFAPVGSLLDHASSNGLRVDRLTASSIALCHLSSGVAVRVDQYVVDGDRCFHDDGRITRWHKAFEVECRSTLGVEYATPSDVERYLDERFGNWRTPTIFYNDDFDSPCSTFNHSLEALFSLYRIAETLFRTRENRHLAYVTSDLMRDRFDIDVTMHLPQSPHRKVLSLPPDAAAIGDRVVVLVAGTFETVDADAVRRWSAVRASDRFVVAAIRATEQIGARERLATIKSLAAFDHVVSYRSNGDLRCSIEELRARALYLDDVLVGEPESFGVPVENLVGDGGGDR